MKTINDLKSNLTELEFTIKTLPCMVSILGKFQTFKVGDKIEIFNTITKEVYRTAIILNRGQQLTNKGEKLENSLRSARVLNK
jgi:hypothetical protein